jgi:hypothetical protein
VALFTGPGPKQPARGSPSPPAPPDLLGSLLSPRGPTCQPLRALSHAAPRRPLAPLLCAPPTRNPPPHMPGRPEALWSPAHTRPPPLLSRALYGPPPPPVFPLLRQGSRRAPHVKFIPRAKSRPHGHSIASLALLPCHLSTSQAPAAAAPCRNLGFHRRRHPHQ